MTYEFRVVSYQSFRIGTPYRHEIPGLAHYLAYWVETDGGVDAMDWEDRANAAYQSPST